jgi:hypothetical protein
MLYPQPMGQAVSSQKEAAPWQLHGVPRTVLAKEYFSFNCFLEKQQTQSYYLMVLLRGVVFGAEVCGRSDKQLLL